MYVGVGAPPQCTNPMYRSGTFEARVHSCTLGYMRVAKLLRFLLTAVKLIIYKNIFKALHIRTFNMPVFVVHVG